MTNKQHAIVQKVVRRLDGVSEASWELQSKVKRYLKLREMIKPLEDEYNDLKSELLEAAVRAKGKAITPTHIVSIVSQERKSWNMESLTMAGVTPKQIDKATIITPVTFARVDKIKEKE